MKSESGRVRASSKSLTLLGIKQPSLSNLEKQSDMQISTLRRIVNALGGELEVSARFPAGTVKIEPFNEMGSGEAVSP